MNTTHQNQNPTPVGPTCRRPCHPEQRANTAPGILRPQFRFHLRRFLAAAVWLGIVAGVQATSVSITDHTPKAITPNSAYVTVNISVTWVVVIQ